MSARSKNRAKEKRKRDKQARKAAEKAKYEGWKRDGINSKSKRAKKNEEAKKGVRIERHAKGDCGNIGCSHCNPPNYAHFLSLLKAGESLRPKVYLEMRAKGLVK